MDSKAKTYYEQEIERMAANQSIMEHQYVQVRQSKAFMEKHFSQKIELEKMAAAAFMSRFHYIRIFQQIYGTTPRQYLKNLRISKAKELLKAGGTVTEVCFEVGYDSLPTFSSAFKRGTGHSPRMYRSMYKSNRE